MQSIIQRDDKCFICRGVATDEHHVLGGRNRSKSTAHGLTIRLCRKCHMGIHNATEGSPYKEAEEFLHKVAQQEFERRYSHEMWMKEFGKNYL